jgi:hypothetical protein
MVRAALQLGRRPLRPPAQGIAIRRVEHCYKWGSPMRLGVGSVPARDCPIWWASPADGQDRTTGREIGRYGLGQSASAAANPGQVGNPPGERRTEQFPPLPRPLTVQPVQTRETHGHFVVGVQADHTILWALLATASAATGEFIGGELRLCRSHGRSLAPGCSLGTTNRAAGLSLSILSPTWRRRWWSSTRLTAYRAGVLPGFPRRAGHSRCR